MTALPERHALSAGEDGTVRLWDLRTSEQLAVFTGDAPFRCCIAHDEGGLAVVGDASGHLHMLEILL